MLLTAVLLKAESFAEMQLLKGICYNKIYTITGYTIEQINCDDNGAYEDPKSEKKDYLVEIKRNMLKASIIHKEEDRYIHKVRNGRSYDTVVVDLKKVYMIERYYHKNKSFPGLRHIAVKIENATKLCYEKYFCIVYSICEETDTQMSYTKVLPHGNSSKTKHTYIRTSQYMLNAECQLLESNKPHKVYEDLVAASDPFTKSSQLEEPRNLKQNQNGKYLVQKKTKANGKVNINRFLSLVFLLLEEIVFLRTKSHEIDKVQVNREISYYLLNHIFKTSVKFSNPDFSLDFSIIFNFLTDYFL